METGGELSTKSMSPERKVSSAQVNGLWGLSLLFRVGGISWGCLLPFLDSGGHPGSGRKQKEILLVGGDFPNYK